MKFVHDLFISILLCFQEASEVKCVLLKMRTQGRVLILGFELLHLTASQNCSNTVALPLVVRVALQ